MAATYPSAIVPLTTKNDTDTIFASHVDALQDEVIAMETALLSGFQHNLVPLNDNSKDLGDVAHAWKNIFSKGTVQLNGVIYTFPAGDGTSGQQLQTNGSKVLSWANPALSAPVPVGGSTDGQLLIGRTSDHTLNLATLATGGGITITNGASTITLTAKVLDKSTTEQDVSNTAVETSVYSFSVPGGTLGTANVLRLTVTGLTNVSGTSDTVTIRVKFGGTTIATAAIGLTATQNGAYRLSVTINANGATGSQRAVTVLEMFNLAVSGVAGTLTQGQSTVGTTFHDTLAIDSTGAQTLTVTAQWSGTLASDHFKRWLAMTELLQ